jgi:putative colanic acid biosynthesis UDP-glucose lipid carrier transferase
MNDTVRRIQQASTWLGFGYRLVDLACIAVVLDLASRLPSATPIDFVFACGTVAVAYFLVAEITGVYRSWRGTANEREAGCVIVTWLGASALVLATTLVSDRLAGIPRPVAVAWFIGTPLLIVLAHTALRVVQRYLFARGINTRTFAIVGVNDLGFELAKNIAATPEMGLRLIGYYDDRPENRRPNIPADRGPYAGNISQLVADARRGVVDRIYITFPMRAEDRIRKVLRALSDSTASVYIVPDFFVFEMLCSRWTSVGGLPAVSVFENPFFGVDGALKRFTDLVFTIPLLLLLAIPMGIIALAIKYTSPGPVFFRQRRYGLDGKEIYVWKFRSMRVMENGSEVKQATLGDARITPLGAFLRKTSLDELPQLFNVLEGSMSLVGPRPHATAHNEQYRKVIGGYMLRHKVRPGITGLAQVSGWRGETDTLEKMERRVECDHRYIRDWSWWLDFWILIRTGSVVFGSKNAY